MSRLASLLLLAVAVAASGCVTAQAKGEPGGPALAPPDPPPHAVIPVEIVEGVFSQPPSGLPASVSAPPSGEKPPKSGGGSSKEPAGKPPDAAPVQPATPPAPPLQTQANVVRVANDIDKVIRQAATNLDSVNAKALDDERLRQYKTAHQFLQEAQEALKVKNLEFARELADKAATLAAALVKK